jgi:hypothetical protein
MTELIETLKAEHADIKEALLTLHELGIDAQEGKKNLLTVKEKLLAHLKKEDTHLYPKLLKAAKTDPIIEDAMDFFSQDIEVVSEVALNFFEKYANNISVTDFEKDFITLTDLLAQRIQKEEAVIYLMYDQL